MWIHNHTSDLDDPAPARWFLDSAGLEPIACWSITRTSPEGAEELPRPVMLDCNAASPVSLGLYSTSAPPAKNLSFSTLLKFLPSLSLDIGVGSTAWYVAMPYKRNSSNSPTKNWIGPIGCARNLHAPQFVSLSHFVAETRIWKQKEVESRGILVKILPLVNGQKQHKLGMRPIPNLQISYNLKANSIAEECLIISTINKTTS